MTRAVADSNTRVGALPGAATAATAANLLHNGGAESGAASLHGWDAVTIPGWSVAAGLPTVVRYGDLRFPAGRGGQLFAGGAGGTARLIQTVVLARPGGERLPAGSAYALSAELGFWFALMAAFLLAGCGASSRMSARQGCGPWLGHGDVRRAGEWRASQRHGRAFRFE